MYASILKLQSSKVKLGSERRTKMYKNLIKKFKIQDTF